MSIHCDLAAIVFELAKLDSAPASVVVQYAPMTFDGRLGRPQDVMGRVI